jgi:hypothetical protein
MALKKVPLNPKPWRHRWDRKPLKGVIYPALKRVDYQEYLQSHAEFKPYERWDMMKHYRESIHDDDHKEIIQDIKKYENEVGKKSEVVVSSKKLTRARDLPKENK